MQDGHDFIFQRRSVRKYLKKDIPDELITELLKAAMAAPSACAKDPWRFIVVKKRDSLTKITEFLPNGKMLVSAAAGIAVCGDIEAAHAGEISFLLQDCSAAIENILLTASNMGLGACWLGVHPRKDRIDNLSAFFGLPGNVIPVSMIALGWPDESHPPRTRYRAEFVHSEKW
jgi:nitroreductase